MSKTTVWTYELDEEKSIARVIETTCAKPGYPNLDEQGRTMYENTHFATREAAQDRLVANVMAAMRFRSKEYQRAIEKLDQVTKELAGIAHLLNRITGDQDP